MHFLDKRTRGKILELKVRCSKDGCDWEGELGDLERHLSNKCLYVKEVCPHGCGQSYPRHILEVHKQDECPQRPFDAKMEALQRQLTFIQQQLKGKYNMNSMLCTLYLIALTLPAPSWLRPTINISNSIVPCYVAMDNFTKHKDDSDKWYSPPFYSGPKGYKMRIKICANGHGEGCDTHVSVYVQIIPGEYDDTLTWPYEGTVTYEIINWKHDKSHIKWTVDFSIAHASMSGKKPKEGECTNNPWGFSKALAHDKIHGNNSPYINNDTIYIRVSCK